MSKCKMLSINFTWTKFKFMVNHVTLEMFASIPMLKQKLTIETLNRLENILYIIYGSIMGALANKFQTPTNCQGKAIKV